ncbi:Ribosomal RNA large subunit methyltransferase G [Roseivivax jejudonensis]|uniref:Ribosomal RNA large subunit methyltransferase G n=1 Tax=Roseivivax jejudonensis TaxID=1529041 RepID=A0A1X6ZJJ8_9RHOB|nr:methyltransferase [Roseivivax jejudonensis]SLN52916.1 Ribosomal RNA large subunit methyltransferase G [Roseivivax jejudonensis]
MTASRLSHAIETGALALPDEGRVAVFGPPGDIDLSALPRERWHLIQPFAPDHAALAARGFECATVPATGYAASLVVLPRARDRGEAWIAAAEEATQGPVIVEGAKTDGIDALIKAARKRVAIEGQVAKAHGKLFWFTAGDAFADWRRIPTANAEGFLTAPGTFSADGVDPASAALAEMLPGRLGPVVADLGAGWGYLATEILGRAGVERVHLLEADRDALDCAEANVDDPRAAFHWADARGWAAPEPIDTVVSNPPFHIGRAPDPALGRAFIAAAARMLTPQGALWLVANRHLPYETALEDAFRDVAEAGGDRRFKILHAARPRSSHSTRARA